MGKIEARMNERGITLPSKFYTPVANAVPWRRAANFVFIAGQGPHWDGEFVVKGRLGEDCSFERGQEAARICALNIIYFLREACQGDLDRAANCMMLQAYVRCTDDFNQQPAVINAASDLLIEVFEEGGRHARTAVGVNALPRDIPVEISAIWEVRD